MRMIVILVVQTISTYLQLFATNISKYGMSLTNYWMMQFIGKLLKPYL